MFARQRARLSNATFASNDFFRLNKAWSTGLIVSIVSYSYAALLCLGGAAGFARGSTASLAAGCGAGALFALAERALGESPT